MMTVARAVFRGFPADQYIEAKADLSRLMEQRVKGDSFIIAKVGKPLVW